MKRVFVTGMGAVTPIGIGIEEFASNLKAGVSGVGPISRFGVLTMRRNAASSSGFTIRRR